MAESVIIVPPDSTGKSLRTFTGGASLTHQQGVVICDSAGNIVGSVGSSAGGDAAARTMGGSPGSRQNVILSTAAAGVAPTASDAMLALQLSRNNATAGAAATSNALTANKTFRIMSMALTVAASTTTALRVSASLRFNSAGAVTVTSALLGTFVNATPGAVAIVGNPEVWTFADGLDIPAGATPGQIGVSIIGSSATGLCWVTIVGYEY